MQESNIDLHSNYYGPHVQNILIDNQESPVRVLMAHECVSYYLPSSSSQSFDRSEDNYNERQMLWRSLIRIIFMGLFLIVFVIVVYKVIEREVTKRIMMEREQRNSSYKMG
ncbi:hypothetical protein ACQ4LE_004870 [Meloidogyne hapla]|uniref:Uncharacterized protein n=1 Tax=Meloidogyne hapla TaxID=6305 RepID=A0A1I8BNN5_MELHA